MTAIRQADRSLVEELLRRIAPKADVVPGEWSGSLQLDGFGVDLQVRIHRRIEHGEALTLINQALAYLKALDFLLKRCPADSARKSPFGGRAHCRNDIAVVVVGRPRFEGERCFNGFYCTAHGSLYKTTRDVTAVLPLPKAALKSIWAEKERMLAARRAALDEADKP